MPANFEPDEDYGYSNTNYLLISRFIEKVVGYCHNQYIKEEILIPLGLSNTFSSMHDVDNIMSGFHVGYESDLKIDYNGSMMATAEDERVIYSSIYV